MEDEAPTSAAGTAEVLKNNLEVWSGHWRTEGGRAPDTSWWESFPQEVISRGVDAGAILAAASSFSSTTSCSDGLPTRASADLSPALLEVLAGMSRLWELTLLWPTPEMQVVTVLIPKATGGERPIALFRSVIRVVAKAKA